MLQVCYSSHAQFERFACLRGHAGEAACRKVLYAPKIGTLRHSTLLCGLLDLSNYTITTLPFHTGLLSIISSKMCSVTKNITKASVSIGMSPLKAVLMDFLACVLGFVDVLLVVIITSRSSHESGRCTRFY